MISYRFLSKECHIFAIIIFTQMKIIQVNNNGIVLATPDWDKGTNQFMHVSAIANKILVWAVVGFLFGREHTCFLLMI